MKKKEYFIVDSEALPEVYRQVIEVKKLLSSEKVTTIQQAVDRVGLSRSSFYKYKDLIEPFTDMAKSSTVTFYVKLEDRVGALRAFLSVIEKSGVNVLTLNQSVAIGGIGDLTVTVDVPENGWTIDDILEAVREVDGVASVRILGRQ